MEVVSSYKVQVLSENSIFRDTVFLYRSALSFLIGVFDSEWDVLHGIKKAKERFNAAERLVHGTKYNVAKGGLFYASIIMATAFAILAFVLFPSAVKGFDESEYLISDGMIAEIRAGDFERLYNTYNTGGYLIYKEIPVFIDSRADLYPEDMLRDGKALQYWTCDEQEVIKKYQFDGFLIGNKDPIKKYFDLSGKYAQVYADESHSLYRAGIPEDATSKSSMNKQIKE